MTLVEPQEESADKTKREVRAEQRKLDPASGPLQKYGPSALLTPANLVTVTRIVLAFPLFFALADHSSSWPLFFGWVFLGLTDRLDGWLARRDGSTRSGAFLDPIADKFLILGGSIACVIDGAYWWLPVLSLAAREIGISAFRSIAGLRGFVFPARALGKWKTTTQIIAVSIVVLPLTNDWETAQAIALWVAVVITWISGVDIVLGARRRFPTKQLIDLTGEPS